MTDLTVVVPVFNEEDGIGRLETSFLSFFNNTNLTVQVVIVDDGSTDQSLEKIKVLCDSNPHYDFISMKENKGLSAALKVGIDACQSTWVGYIDADLQTSPEDFLLFEPYIEEYDLVMGNRTERKDNLTKRITS